jgi:hypothetical protein
MTVSLLSAAIWIPALMALVIALLPSRWVRSIQALAILGGGRLAAHQYSAVYYLLEPKPEQVSGSAQCALADRPWYSIQGGH